MRQLTPYAQSSSQVTQLLQKLVDKTTGEREYAASFYELGKVLSSLIQHSHHLANSHIMLACSSEDADWLSKGILDDLTENDIDTRLAVFWNLRENPEGNKDIAIAPITKSYVESLETVDYLIICKSIINSSCVVRTNITYIIERIKPRKIIIASPVLYEDAIPNLKSEFPEQISKKFEFFYFAVDNEINEKQEVIPGIGGSIYKRLGLGDNVEKNKYIPAIVKERRAAAAAANK